MAYQALYRKFRPYNFYGVFGQDDIVKTLQNQIKNNQIAHAYLFCGTRGTGKTSLAKIMACAVNCFNINDSEPCGECKSCVSLKEENNMDVLELDAASRNGVDDMRELLEQVVYPPQISKYKVYIIDEVHMLSTAAFNALLKTLEEPPEYIIFILATTEPQKIPATILSRCQRYDLSRVSSTLILKHMKKALDNMGIDYDDNALNDIALASEGSVRDAWSILDTCVSGLDKNTKLDIKTVQSILGTSKKDFLFKFSNAIIKSDQLSLMSLSNELFVDGKDPMVFLKQLSEHFRLIMLVKLSNDKKLDERINDDDFSSFSEQAKAIDSNRIIQTIDTLMLAESRLKWSASPRIAFESIVLNASMPIINQENSLPNNVLELINSMELKIGELQRKLEQKELEKPLKKESIKESYNSTATVEKPKYNIDANTAQIWKCALEKAKQEITLFIHIKTAKLVKEGKEFRLIFPFSSEASYSRMAYKENSDKINKLVSDLIGQSVSIKLEIEQNLTEKKLADQSSTSLQSLLSTLPRELIDIKED